MNITRVVYGNCSNKKGSYLVCCSVVLDDCLRLNDIRLFKDDIRGYFLVLPNKSDIYKEVIAYNKKCDRRIEVPECGTQKHFRELYHPVDSDFYNRLLNTIVDGYNSMIKTGRVSYRP